MTKLCQFMIKYIIEDGKVALEGDFNQLKDNAILVSYRNISKDEIN